MKMVVVMIFAFLGFCSTTAQHKHPARHHAPYHYHAAPTMLKTGEWMKRYQELEDHFDYSIDADDDIKPVGKNFKVPKICEDHYNDMKNADKR